MRIKYDNADKGSIFTVALNKCHLLPAVCNLFLLSSAPHKGLYSVDFERTDTNRFSFLKENFPTLSRVVMYLREVKDIYYIIALPSYS